MQSFVQVHCFIDSFLPATSYFFLNKCVLFCVLNLAVKALVKSSKILHCLLVD